MSKTALLFAGQGAQVVGMGRDFNDQLPEARTLFEQANATLGYDLSGVCFSGPEGELTKTEHAQPGIYLASWVAYALLRSRLPNLLFEATAGLSLGEFTALTAAGVWSFEAGLKVVRQRGIAMQAACEATRGGMAAVIGLDEAETRSVCDKTGVQLANLNCPGQIVISGELERLTPACELAKEKGARRALPLPVAGAYHSRLMESAVPALREALSSVPLNPAACLVMSNVTGNPHGTPETIESLLLEQVCATVRWEDCLRQLLSSGFTRFIELGPGTTLSGFMKRIDRNAEVHNVADAVSLEKTVAALKD